MRPLGKLTDIKCRTVGTGIYSDGGGLVLQVKAGVSSINRSWIFRYAVDGREHRMGLGSYPDVTLARAREKAQDARRLRIEGQGPTSDQTR
jgi:hypothetical protein